MQGLRDPCAGIVLGSVQLHARMMECARSTVHRLLLPSLSHCTTFQVKILPFNTNTATLYKQQNHPGSSKSLVSALFLQPQLDGSHQFWWQPTTCLSSCSSSLHFHLSRMFSPKVTLQQLSRSFPLSHSAGKEIFKNQSTYFLSCVQRFLRAGGKPVA